MSPTKPSPVPPNKIRRIVYIVVAATVNLIFLVLAALILFFTNLACGIEATDDCRTSSHTHRVVGEYVATILITAVLIWATNHYAKEAYHNQKSAGWFTLMAVAGLFIFFASGFLLLSIFA